MANELDPQKMLELRAIYRDNGFAFSNGRTVDDLTDKEVVEATQRFMREVARVGREMAETIQEGMVRISQAVAPLVTDLPGHYRDQLERGHIR